MPKIKFSNFTIQGEKSSNQIKIYLPSSGQEKEDKLGQLFIFLEMGYVHADNQKIAELVKNGIFEKFYSSGASDFELAFEEALSGLNKEMSAHVVGMPEEWLAKTSMLIAAIKNGKIVFSNVGKINGFLINNDKIFNIIGPSQEKPNPLKFFGSVSSGDLPLSSTLIFCDEKVLDYFSQEKIRKTIAENPVDEAALYLKNILEEQNGQNSFGILIASLSEQAPAKNTPEKKEQEGAALDSQDDSMVRLIEKESRTKELLTPSVWPSIKKNAARLKGFFTSKTEKLRPQTKITRANKRPNKIIRAIEMPFVMLKNLFGRMAKKRERADTISALPYRTTSWLSRLLLKLKRLSLARKILLVLAIALIIIFAWSITGIGNKREKDLKQNQYQEILTDVDKKIDEAKAAILYDNEDGAREILAQANESLSQIPNDKKWQEEKQERSAAITEQFNKVSHVVKVENPEQVLDFSAISSEISINNIIKIEDSLYAFAANNSSVYLAKLSDKSTAKLIDSSDQKKLLSTAILSSRAIVSLYQDNELANIDLSSKQASDLKINFSNVDKEIKDLEIFSNKLYLLDVKNKQIFKFSKSGDTFSNQQSWLGEDTDNLDKAVSMAIDGSIYVLYDDGSLQKYFGGRKDANFKSVSLKPSLENATKIYATENDDHLYVLDPNNKRLVVLEKNGRLINQYTSDQFSDLKDFTIDGETKSAYLLSGTRIFSFNLDI